MLLEPAEYMDAPCLHESGAETALFGAPASLAAKATRFAGMPPARRILQGTLITAQERLIFEQFNYARMRQFELLDQFRDKRMPIGKLRLLLAWVHRGMDIRNQIVESNIPLVLAMIRRSRWSSVDHNDLLSEGSLALLRCVRMFDCSLGFKFSTYACRAVLKSFARVGFLTSRYHSRFPVSPDPAREPSDFLERKRENDVTKYMEEVREILATNRAELSANERAVITARFSPKSALPDLRYPTLAEIGDLIGVTKERVRQVQNSALRKLREVLEVSFLPVTCMAESRAVPRGYGLA